MALIKGVSSIQGRVPHRRFSVYLYGIDSETRPYLKEHYIMKLPKALILEIDRLLTEWRALIRKNTRRP